jgi:osmotically-inducible protein OsmY
MADRRERDYEYPQDVDEEHGGIWSPTWGRGYQGTAGDEDDSRNRSSQSWRNGDEAFQNARMSRNRNFDYAGEFQRRYGTYLSEVAYDQRYGSGPGRSGSFGQRDLYNGPYTGRGPQGFQRQDDRIHEDVNDRLTWHGEVDATNIQVTVENGEVTLEGTVDDRRQKRLAEDIAEDVSGVKDIHNRLRIGQNLIQQVAQGISDIGDRLKGDK